MKWVSVLSEPHSERSSLKQVLNECVENIKKQLNGQNPDLLLCFISPHFITHYDQVPSIIRRTLNPKTFIGCSAGGLIGDGNEVELEPAIALTAAVLPNVVIKPFHVSDNDMPDLDDGPSEWEACINVEGKQGKSFILLADPFSIRIDVFLQGLDFAYPLSSKIGGLASGAQQPGMNALFLNNHIFRDGLVGIALEGDIEVDTIVAQGCRPIGRPFRVTKCDRNLVYELDGEPAINALHVALESLTDPERELAKHSLFLGVAMNEFKEKFRAGDFLIRNILGLEPNSGALLVGEIMRPERTIQFHLRDAATSADDLRLLLKSYCDSHERNPAGALLFSCLGRGKNLYGVRNHDSDLLKAYLGTVPIGGFFCNGEIGPVGNTTFIHGYTSSFGIIRTKGESK